MKIQWLTPKETLKALGIGVLTAVLLSAAMVPAFKFGIAPMPKPPSLAFAQLLLGPNVSLAVGLLFHVAYVTFWALVYVVVFRDHLTFLNALWLGVLRAWDKPEVDSGVARASRTVCGFPLGIVPTGL
jgi:hypothetical protein